MLKLLQKACLVVTVLKEKGAYSSGEITSVTFYLCMIKLQWKRGKIHFYPSSMKNMTCAYNQIILHHTIILQKYIYMFDAKNSHRVTHKWKKNVVHFSTRDMFNLSCVCGQDAVCAYNQIGREGMWHKTRGKWGKQLVSCSHSFVLLPW